MRRSLLSIVLSLSLLLSTLVAAQAAEYTFTTINPYGFTHAHGINDNGQIVGLSGTHGFLWDGTTFTSIDVPGAMRTLALGINNSGQVVGHFNDAMNRNHGFLTSDGTTFTIIDAQPNINHTSAFGVNTAGQIVGNFFTITEHGFLTSDGTTFTTIDVPNATATGACGINDSSQIVGFFNNSTGERGFLTSDGTTFTPIDVPGATRTVACGINNKGQIVGWFIDARGIHGFLKDGTTFTTIDVPNATATGAFGINNSGEIVGYFTDARSEYGFLATPTIPDKIPPVITVAASPETLWPPNEKLVDVMVSGTMTDSGGSEVSASSAAYVVMDEYGRVQPKGGVTLTSNGNYAFTVKLQASRNGNDPDGRHYTIVVSAKDNAGNLGFASTTVTVPRDQGQ